MLRQSKDRKSETGGLRFGGVFEEEWLRRVRGQILTSY